MRINLQQAADILNSGGVVAIPTETVYGLAARLHDESAIKKIFLLKNRPADNPLIVHVKDQANVAEFSAGLPDKFDRILSFWPGPLTIVVSANLKKVPSIARAGLNTVAVRVPGKKMTRDLICLTGPLVAPSANISGRPSATRASHVEEDFGVDFPVLDDGPCDGGVESTVIDLTGAFWSLLRHGAVTEDQLEAVLGKPVQSAGAHDRPRSPGQKYRHYAPKCKLVSCSNRRELAQQLVRGGFDAVLGFDDTAVNGPVVSLGDRARPWQNLKTLYSTLRELDRLGYSSVLVDMDFEGAGLGHTLKERLTKACEGEN